MILRSDGRLGSCYGASARRLLCLALLLSPLGANAQEMRPITGAPNPPSPLEVNLFEEIYAVFPKHEELFVLTRPFKAPSRELRDLGLLTPESLILAQNYEVEPSTPSAFDRITCERQFTIGIWSRSNVLGKFVVGFCNEQAKHVDEVARNAGNQLKKILGLLKTPQSAQTAEAGMIYEVTPIPGGAQMYYFPVVVAAPGGIEALQTAVVVWSNRGRATIIQLDAGHTCHSDSRNRSNIPVCVDSKKKLQKLTQRVAQRFEH